MSGEYRWKSGRCPRNYSSCASRSQHRRSGHQRKVSRLASSDRGKSHADIPIEIHMEVGCRVRIEIFKSINPGI